MKQMTNQIENQYIHHINLFLSFIFGVNNENDPEQRIYNKLLQLEGDELETWMNTKLKRFITGEGRLSEFQGDKFEGIQGRTIFISWYFLKENWNGPQAKLVYLYDIYYNNNFLLVKEFNERREKLIQHGYKDDNYISWDIEMMNDYLKMFIMAMTSSDLKAYIIQLIEPIEIR